MRRLPSWNRIVCVAAACSLGCASHAERLFYFGDEDLAYYKGVATSIEQPAVESPVSQAVLSDAPRTIRDRSEDEVWEMSYVESLHLALAHNRVIRSAGTFLSPGNPLLRNPDYVASVYDPAIQETGFLFGLIGVEAALAPFDARFQTSMTWGRDEQAQNSIFASNLIPEPFRSPETITSEAGNFNSELTKIFATGGQFTVGHSWDYEGSNEPGRLFPSAYTGLVRAQFRQPLWAGSGVEYSRIAGPVQENIAGITGVSQGVLIARINQDISQADFELNVTNLTRDVEVAYWDLYLAYRQFDARVNARNIALRTWDDVKTELDAGRVGPGDEAQARANYFQNRAGAEEARADMYERELRLRRLCGLSVNDGRIIRPSDEPVKAAFHPDWNVTVAEGLTRRTELRRQRWNITSLELQLRAAHSQTNPRLDFVSGYQVNGFGDRLFGENDNDGLTNQGFDSAYETLTQGNQTGWDLGLQMGVPIGFRLARSQVRNYELRLEKARAVLEAQELEVAHELANAIQLLDRSYLVAQTNYNRLQAEDDQLDALVIQYRAGQIPLDLLLRSQNSRAEAEVAFFSSLVEYNKALVDLQLRKGTLLEANQVHLAEGTWTADAYREALRRAWARSYALPAEHLDTVPEPFAIPAPQSSGVIWHSLDDADAAHPSEPAVMPIPAPPADSEPIGISRPTRATPTGTTPTSTTPTGTTPTGTTSTATRLPGTTTADKTASPASSIATDNNIRPTANSESGSILRQRSIAPAVFVD